MRLEGWKITWLAAGIMAAMLLALLVWHGASEEGVRAMARSSARHSVILFLLAFSASSMHWFIRRGWTAWLLRNRRYVGVSFAVSHFYHLLALVALAVWFPHPFLDRLNGAAVIGGGLAYAFIAAMTATSSDRARRWLGLGRWKLLHTVGSYYLWFVFAQSYFPRASQQVFYAAVLVALVVVVFLRMLLAFQRRGQRDGVVRAE